MKLSPNARTVLVAAVTAAVFFALGRVTSESVSPARAPSGGDVPATISSAPLDEELAASASGAPSSARASVVSEPIDSVVEAQAPSSMIEELRLAEQAELEASLGAHRSPSDGPAPRARPTAYSWEEAKLSMRGEFEVNHEDAQYMRDRLFELEFALQVDGTWRHADLDARERSGTRIAAVLGDVVGVGMLAEPSKTRACVTLADCRDRLAPIVERAIDAWEAARLEIWRRELGVVWRAEDVAPRTPQSPERGLYNCGGQSLWHCGWRMRYVLDSADHPEFEALLQEIERIKAACVAELAALGW